MNNKPVPIAQNIELVIDRYFEDMEEESIEGLYSKVIAEVEEPLLNVVMKRTSGNQSEAAKILGINRNTLRKKLKQYQIIT